MMTMSEAQQINELFNLQHTKRKMTAMSNSIEELRKAAESHPRGEMIMRMLDQLEAKLAQQEGALTDIQITLEYIRAVLERTPPVE